MPLRPSAYKKRDYPFPRLWVPGREGPVTTQTSWGGCSPALQEPAGTDQPLNLNLVYLFSLVLFLFRVTLQFFQFLPQGFHFLLEVGTLRLEAFSGLFIL